MMDNTDRNRKEEEEEEQSSIVTSCKLTRLETGCSKKSKKNLSLSNDFFNRKFFKSCSFLSKHLRSMEQMSSSSL